jgi:hypothetical protein
MDLRHGRKAAAPQGREVNQHHKKEPTGKDGNTRAPTLPLIPRHAPRSTQHAPYQRHRQPARPAANRHDTQPPSPNRTQTKPLV